MKRIRFAITLLALISLCTSWAFAQVRPDIYSFTPAQRTLLANKIIDYVNPAILQQHCNYDPGNTGSPDIHSDFDFLPFHRTYIEGLEDYLLEQGLPQFVPLPAWNPATCAPAEFQTAGPGGNGIDPDCATPSCANGNGACNNVVNWCPNVALPVYLSLPVQAGSNNDICDWNMDPTSPSSANCCPNGLSRKMETPYHNNVHLGMSGTMSNFRSPAVAAFWIWHAYLDDQWKKWECNCPQSTTANIDLYSKDSPKTTTSDRDRGEEPNIDTGPMWVSEDIWVRNQNDGLSNHNHQNPEYMALPGNFNYVYVQVRNRGCSATVAGQETVSLHWAKAATALSWPNYWDGSITSPALMGDVIGVLPVPSLQPGESAILEFPWQPENPANYVGINSEPHHFCLLSRILSTNDPMTFPEGSSVGANVKNNNNIVWKNVSVVDLIPGNIVGGGGGWQDEVLPGAVVFLGNAWKNIRFFDLVLDQPEGALTPPIAEQADIKITMDEAMWRKWQKAGARGKNIEVIQPDKFQVRVTGSPAALEGMEFDDYERVMAHISFNFQVDRVKGDTKFAFDVNQYDATSGDLVGGERYEINYERTTFFNADAGQDVNTSPGAPVLLRARKIAEDALYKWYDPTGTLVYVGDEYTFNAGPNNGVYTLEVIALSDGTTDSDQVMVNVGGNTIISMSPNPAAGQVNVEYDARNASTAQLVFSTPFNPNYATFNLDVNQPLININLTGFPGGLYTVSLICDGAVSDSKQLSVR